MLAKKSKNQNMKIWIFLNPKIEEFTTFQSQDLKDAHKK